MNRKRIIEPEGVDLERLTAKRHKKRRIVKKVVAIEQPVTMADLKQIRAVLREGSLVRAEGYMKKHADDAPERHTIGRTWHAVGRPFLLRLLDSAIAEMGAASETACL